MAQVADCFPRRDSRLLAGEAVQAMLMELERRNCWSLAEALGHGGPHRLQHFLSRGAWDLHGVLLSLSANVAYKPSRLTPCPPCPGVTTRPGARTVSSGLLLWRRWTARVR
ncbi:transposase [Streptomyces sp. NPDC002519]